MKNNDIREEELNDLGIEFDDAHLAAMRGHSDVLRNKIRAQKQLSYNEGLLKAAEIAEEEYNAAEANRDLEESSGILQVLKAINSEIKSQDEE